MPLVSPGARAASLANDYGPTRGPNAPDTLRLHILTDDPMLYEDDPLSVEMPNTTDDDILGAIPNGYAPVEFSSDDFAADDVGITATVLLGDALAEWPDDGTYVLLEDAATGLFWDAVPLLEALAVTEAGPIDPVLVTVFYDDDVPTPGE